MSPEGKASIAAVQRTRWAKQKKAEVAPKNTATTSSSRSVKKTSKRAVEKRSVEKVPPANKEAAPTSLPLPISLRVRRAR